MKSIPSLKKALLSTGAALALSLLAIAFLLTRYRPDPEVFREIRVPFLVAAAALSGASWLFDAVRLRGLALASGTRVSLLRCVQAVLAGNFVVNITPFYLGAGLAHIHLLRKAGMSLADSTAVVVAGGVLSHLIQITGAIGALIVLRETVYAASSLASVVWVIAAAYVGVMMSAVVLLLLIRDGAWVEGLAHPRLRALAAALLRLRGGIKALVTSCPRALVQASAATVCYLACFYSITWVLLRGLGAPISPAEAVAAQLVIFVSCSLVPTPGSSGAMEFGAFSLLSTLVSPGTLTVFVVLWRAYTFYANLVIGGPLFFISLRTPPRPDEPVAPRS